jgi:hypothetical protein
VVTSLSKGENSASFLVAFFHVFGFARVRLDIAFLSTGGWG